MCRFEATTKKKIPDRKLDMVCPAGILGNNAKLGHLKELTLFGPSRNYKDTGKSEGLWDRLGRR